MPMADLYRIVERQLSLVGIGGHNLLALLDPSGNVIGELDGIAVNPGGEPAAGGIGWLPFYHKLGTRVRSCNRTFERIVPALGLQGRR